nr:MAG TPA: hypothetical protein [Caudoviricetes sp.]
MAKNSGNTRTISSANAASSRINANKDIQPKPKAESKQMNYQNITDIDRSKFSSFSKTLPQHIKDMTNVDINKAINGTSKKLGGYINIDFNQLKNNEAATVKSYLTKKGYYYEDNGAVNTAIFYKRNYKGK